MRRILEPGEWGMVEPVVVGEAGNAMPATPAQGAFLAEVVGGRLAGFVHLETLYHFAYTHVAPDFRGRGLALSLLADAARRIPAGFSGVLMTERGAGLTARLVGAREVGRYNVYRRDV